MVVFVFCIFVGGFLDFFKDITNFGLLILQNWNFSLLYAKKEISPYLSSCREVKCSSLIWAIFIGHLLGQIVHVSEDYVSVLFW